jgi:hypothetical protein
MSGKITAATGTMQCEKLPVMEGGQTFFRGEGRDQI